MNRSTVPSAQVLLLILLGSTFHAVASPSSVTGDFLCHPDQGQGSAAILQEASPLWGASEIYVSRAGSIVVVDVRRDPDLSAVERRYQLYDSREAQRALDLLCAGNVLDVEPRSGQDPPGTCIDAPQLIMLGSGGETRVVPFPRNGPSDEYEAAWLNLSELKRKALRGSPVYEGPYAPEYVPEEFLWARPILGPLKAITFTPAADPEDLARAVKDFEARIELQLEAIARVRAEEEKGGTP